MGYGFGLEGMGYEDESDISDISATSLNGQTYFPSCTKSGPSLYLMEQSVTLQYITTLWTFRLF